VVFQRPVGAAVAFVFPKNKRVQTQFDRRFHRATRDLGSQISTAWKQVLLYLYGDFAKLWVLKIKN
jgi:hypothetical protein